MTADFHEQAAGPRFDAVPVLPSEAKDLRTHVDQCARRYVALLQYLNLLSRRMRGLRIENWIYRAVTLPVLLWIALELYRMRSGS
ncbi:MAG: hypothetical protein K0S54_3281 [Alphaproteobacteria bacterium]|nr:hypothetical protein [Alphaproteobacteria bacterium]